MSDPVKLQNTIHYTFRNPELLKEALTHRSFATENNLPYNNQRLEFLGDAVLQIILSEFLFHRYPDYQEGDMTKLRSALANQDSLAGFAREIELGNAILLGHGEIGLGGNLRDSTLSDAMEALIAAIMLDSSIDNAKEFFLKLMLSKYPEPSILLKHQNPKGELQEYTQSCLGCQPCYKVISQEGPDHHPVYTIEVSIRGTPVAKGEACKRKTAESLAAQAVLEQIENGTLQFPNQHEQKEIAP